MFSILKAIYFTVLSFQVASFPKITTNNQVIAPKKIDIYYYPPSPPPPTPIYIWIGEGYRNYGEKTDDYDGDSA
jgi:hypothetical protein